ncbi:MAG: M23 family metallopeptidase [Pseudomonadota bacterium]
MIVLAAAFPAAADTLYKYQDADGNWIFSDRPPPDGREAETRRLEDSFRTPELTVRHQVEGQSIRFVAQNGFHAPVEVMLRFRRLSGVGYPDPDEALRWTVPAGDQRALMQLDIRPDGPAPSVEYEYEYMAGSPDAVHRPEMPYRIPYALATEFSVTQAYPDNVTHKTPDSAHAVDFAMPIGTDIFAARGGVVFAVTSQNYRGGLDTSRDGARANVVQILHDDGTFAVYAHLNWNSIRVKPGDRVARGQYIADSGNTGFSTGPHLHFAVLQNVGMRLVSVPLQFEGRNSSAVVPATGQLLTAY